MEVGPVIREDWWNWLAGLILGAALGMVLVVIGSINFQQWHAVAPEQRVCMTIADDGSSERSRREVYACATGEELMAYLRKREGVQ